MSNKCVHEWYYRIVDIVSWQFFCIRCGEKLSMDKFSNHASDLEKRMAELGKATACIAELEEQVWNLNLENERLEEAYWIDETISPDGTLKPSVRKLLERLEKAETDLRLSDDLVKALDNRIAKLEAENDQLTARNAELRGFIDQLIEVGNGMKSFLTPYVDGFRDSYPATSAWESLVKDWKEREE